MCICKVINKAGFPPFIHAKPHLFARKKSVLIGILAGTADEDCLLLADFAFTLVEPIRSNSLLYSSSLSRT